MKSTGRLARALLAGAVLTGITSVTANAAGAALSDNKTYVVTVNGTTTGAAPEAYAGDADATARITITNTSSPQSIGSVNIVVPSTFTLRSATGDTIPGGPVIELRNLNLAPGASINVDVVLTVTSCANSTTTFGVTAKQANDYSGTGNDYFLGSSSDTNLAVVGSCKLAWAAQPEDALRSAAITSTPFTPSGVPVAVTLLDASGTATATAVSTTVNLTAANPSVTSPVLGGTISASTTLGVARFSPGPSFAVSAFSYTLTASASGIASTPASNPFDIVDDRVDCPANTACQRSASAAKNGATVTATFGSGTSAVNLLVSIDAADAPTFTCANYPRPSGALVSQFVFTGGSGDDRTGTMTTTIPSATRPLNTYGACWAAPYPFTTVDGTTSVAQGTKPGTTQPLYVGLLPDCAKRGTVVLPCVSSKTYDKTTKAVSITVQATGADPWRY